MFATTQGFILASLLSQIYAREFSTNLYQLDKRIRFSTPNLQHATTNRFQDVTLHFQPLNTLACDTQRFQEQTKNKWHKYTSLITDNTPGKRPQFNPEHHSHYFQKISWSPDTWTTITHHHEARKYHFEMIYLQLVQKPLYIIYTENAFEEPHDLHYFNSGDTIALISRIIAYFYEHFTSVKFKLFARTRKSDNEFRGNCYFSAKKFPLITQVLQTPVTTQHIINTPCDEAKLIRTFTIDSTHYMVTFPKNKITNEVPEVRNVHQYIEQIGHNYALGFQWSNPTDTGYNLEIEIGEKLSYIPRTWWIHEQSDSLLGFHKNFFLPTYFQTLQTTYSYARNSRHYFAEGFYVKKPGVTYFRQNVREHTPVITSWPIPTEQINIKHPPIVYFKPHLGNLETLLPKVLTIIERSPHIAQISKCQNYTATFHTLQQDRSNYHQTISDQEKQLLPSIYSYEQPPHAQSDQRTNNIAQANLQRRVDDKAQLFTLIWKNVHPHILNLENNLLTYSFERNEKIRLEAEKRLYMTFTYQRKWVDARISDARSNKQRAYAQLLHESNYLSAIIPAIHQRFREMYAMTLQHKAIRLLRHSRHLQPYVLYQHIIKSNFVKSYPLKFDAERATPQRLQISFPTPNIQIINHSSPTPITPILRQTLPELINPHTQKSPLSQQTTK